MAKLRILERPIIKNGILMVRVGSSDATKDKTFFIRVKPGTIVLFTLLRFIICKDGYGKTIIYKLTNLELKKVWN